MDTRLPVFPLGTVLFPGLVLPLHIFEARYLELMRHLIDLPEGTPREFGVVAIRSGGTAPIAAAPATATAPESAAAPATATAPESDAAPATATAPESDADTDPASATDGDQERSGSAEPAGHPAAEPAGRRPDASPVTLHEIGCTAELRQVTELADGRLDIVTVGRRRFRIAEVDEESTPYLTAEVEWLPEPAGQEQLADLLAPRVLAVFRRYLTLVRDDPEEISEQLPDDPTVLSHLVAATAALTLTDRQRLLATPDTAGRLSAELRLLNREAALLRQVRAVPVPLTDLAVPASPN